MDKTVRMTRRSFLGATAAGLGGLAVGPAWPLPALSQDSQGGLGDLYKKFQDPDRRCSIRPFWFWNGKLDGAELRRQIKQMVDHGVYGAYVHNRDGLETPYLSEAWWQAVGEALQAAEDYGFSLCMVDEFEWPSGEARDYWLPGINKSRVVAANPAFHMHRLKPEEMIVQGPAATRIPLPAEPVAVVVARQTAYETLDGESLKTLTWEPGSKQIEWKAPAGTWRVFTYGVEVAMGQPDHGHVDLMSQEAIAKFIEIYYDEFYRRYGKHFGHAMPATFADHEGDYGAKLPWTPVLLETFKKRTGYPLDRYLPALTYDIGPKTEKIRCDLLSTVSELYSTNFFQQVTDWCHKHGIEHSGHVWEESLFFGPAEQGDFFRILRSLSNPGCDTLLEWGRQSVWLKEDASVADFEGRHVVCENQGVQGESSYLSPERMRRVSNCLGAWNIGEFIPHAFDYDLSRINFPPDWFRSQPYLPWFHAYADQMRRISFMNRNSQEIADILILYPQISIWGQSSTAFRTEEFSKIMDDRAWSADAADTNSQYAELKLRLSEERLDFKVADGYYLGQSQIEGPELRISNSRSRILILPPMSTIHRATAQKVEQFFRAGGTVIALRRLPTTSVESGRQDPQLAQIWKDTFDTTPTDEAFLVRKNAAGGHAFFVPQSVTDLMQVLDQAITDPDVKVEKGPKDHLYALHKVKDGLDFYWVVNDTDQPRTNLLSLRTSGRPERWDAHTAQRSPLFYENRASRTRVRLSLGAWDACYVVFDPSGPRQDLALQSTNLDDLYIVQAGPAEVTVRGRSLANGKPLIVSLAGTQQKFRGTYQPPAAKPLEITGDWTATIDGGSIPAPYALALDDPRDRGLGAKWYRANKGRLNWKPLWLAPLNYGIRDWNIIGPFPNPEDRGLQLHYPPEQQIQYDAAYTGEQEHRLHWQQLDAAAYETVPAGGGFGLGTMVIRGGPYGADSFLADYGNLLRFSPLDGVVYAQTNIYSPQQADVVMLLGTPNPRAAFLNGKPVYSRWLRPLYNRFIDGFAERVPIHLNAGWNSLLLKFLHNPANPQAAAFTCRVAMPDGKLIVGLAAQSRVSGSSQPSEQTGYRWLRFPVPPLASSIKIPSLRKPWLAFVDDKQVTPNDEISLPQGTRLVTVRVAGDELLTEPFSFSTAPTALALDSWTKPGLERFSGCIVYEKDVNLPQSLLHERLLLDCGAVGVVAEAWINGHSAGARAWRPYTFDVTGLAHAGQNHLKVRVANTAGNARSVGQSRDNIKNIHLNGWLGPARLVPYVDREIHCKTV